MNLEDLEAELTAAFKTAGFDQPRFEARRLLEEAQELNALGKIQEWKIRRCNGEPLAYLTGRRAFYKNTFLVEPGVLVPRPETEHVVEVALRRIHAEKIPVARIVDLGCGSGCIGLSLLLEFATATLVAIDASTLACDVTRRNALALGLTARAEVFNQRIETWSAYGKFNLVVANPPYIAEGDSQVQRSVHAYEPHGALYSGPDGLQALRLWIEWASRLTEGLFVTEIGAGQRHAVQEIMTMNGFRDIKIEKDLAGIERVVSARRES